jgi:hypothetical protein
MAPAGVALALAGLHTQPYSNDLNSTILIQHSSTDKAAGFSGSHAGSKARGKVNSNPVAGLPVKEAQNHPTLPPT